MGIDEGTTAEVQGTSFEERLADFRKHDVVDISNGLGEIVHDSNELMDFIADSTETQNQARFPIIAFKDGTVLMQGGANLTEPSHMGLLHSSGKDAKDIDFAIAIEGINPKDESSYLELKAVRDSKNLPLGSAPIIVRLGTVVDNGVAGWGEIKPPTEDQVNKIFKSIDGVQAHIGPLEITVKGGD